MLHPVDWFSPSFTTHSSFFKGGNITGNEHPQTVFQPIKTQPKTIIMILIAGVLIYSYCHRVVLWILKPYQTPEVYLLEDYKSLDLLPQMSQISSSSFFSSSFFLFLFFSLIFCGKSNISAKGSPWREGEGLGWLLGARVYQPSTQHSKAHS